MSVIYNLEDFGLREKDIASDLLKAYSNGWFKNGVDFFSSGVKVAFNQSSGVVFLVDDDLNVGVLTDDGEIEQFFYCSECGNEGTIEEFKDNMDDCEECERIIDEVE